MSHQPPDTASGAAIRTTIESNSSPPLREARDSKDPDFSPDSEPSAPPPIESDWAPIMEFTVADVFQHSPFGVSLNSLRSLSLSGASWLDYARLDWDVDDEEIRCPPTTHFVATVDNLNDMLDFDSEDIDGMDDDVGEEHEPTPIRHWIATSSHDVYMVDTPKGSEDEEHRDATRDLSLEKQSKQR